MHIEELFGFWYLGRIWDEIGKICESCIIWSYIKYHNLGDINFICLVAKSFLVFMVCYPF